MGNLVALVMTAVATTIAASVALGYHEHLSCFVVPVVIEAVAFGLGPPIYAAVLGALAYNFFLAETRYSLAVNNPANIWAIALLFVVALIVSGVAYTSGRRARAAALQRTQALVLQGYGRDIAAADCTDTIVSLTSQALAQLFEVPVVVMFVVEGKVFSVKKIVRGMEPQETEIDMALLSLATGTVVRAGFFPAVTSRFDFWPVVTTGGQGAVLGLAFEADERPATPEMLVDIVRSVMALALERRKG